VNEKHLFNNGWEFTKRPAEAALADVTGSMIQWNPVQIPHDWLIYDTNNLYETSSGWYRKKFQMKNLKGRRVSVRFDGVYMNTTIYMNGESVFEWKYGYSTFEADITDYVREGENEIIVQVVYQSPNSRWYSGAGIYRNVWLIVTPDIHIASDGIYVKVEKKDDRWIVDVDTEIVYERAGEEEETYSILYQIFDAKGSICSYKEKKISVPNPGRTDHELLSMVSPAIWDVDSPKLYDFAVSLKKNGTILQRESIKIGFRTITFTTDKGLFLNGRHRKIYGVCEHHDLGCLGAAFNKNALRRRFNILKEMGVNAIRTSHNMPAEELMELADEMGFLVDAEAFDMWERSKTTYDYARFFKEWSKKDIKSFVRRDRNHPCLLMWSIGNEIYDTHVDEHGQEITRTLKAYVEEFDYKHNAPATIGSNFMPWENAQKCADILKYAGYNYTERYYEEHHKKHPDWIIYGSETASTTQSRGIYHFPLRQSFLCNDDEQCSSLGNCTTSWGAKSTVACITDDRDAQFSLGQFIWTGFDYIGEPTPYATKNSYFGQVDTAGFKKDTYYIYQAEWTNPAKAPMIHIFPYWDFNEGEQIDVRVCSNLPKVELFFNETSLGTFEIDHKHSRDLIANYKIPYQKGTLKAFGYDEKGRVMAADTRTSFKDAVKIVAFADKTILAANGTDLIFLEIGMEDEDGNPVENANNRVEVTVTGAGRLIGLDNGDSTDYDSYKGTSRRLFSGKLAAVIAAGGKPGEGMIVVSSKGMKDVCIPFHVMPVRENKQDPQASYEDERMDQFYEERNQKSEENNEIPVRKIALCSSISGPLTKENDTVTIKAEIYPKNASWRDIEFRVTNIKGIDSNIVSVKQEGDSVTVQALSDGEFCVKAIARNNKKQASVMSQYTYQVTGMGTANMNPYEFVSAGLYTKSVGDIGNGNERGVSTSRDGESQITFEHLDFGEFGSDEITIPIFELESADFILDMWEGIPGEAGSRKITTLTYHKKSIWNTYQEETYKLRERLSGVKTLTFVAQRKAHIKGFCFKKLEKAYETIYATENDQIYGDSFTVNKDAVEKIGNNVSLEFEGMDFGEEGFKKLIICGHSPIDKNTIHVRFLGENGEEKQMAEFLYSEGYVEREFALSSVTGLNKVTFVFLPGSNFDFKWFRFER